ncbi:MAG: response regulator [Hormoscilla sp.]
MRILLVEDDAAIAEVVKKALTNQHYQVDIATAGQEGWELAKILEYDLMVLDLMLPKLNGIELCQRLRAKGDRTPIMLLTAQDSSKKKVQGLDAGADDYVVKPFDVQELLARIRALLRRGSATNKPVLEWRKLCLDPSICEVKYDGEMLQLTAKEYALMELFLRNPKRIFSQTVLIDKIWEFDEPPSENAVRTQIKGLRQKLKKASAPADFIETIYGLGYRLKSIKAEGEKTRKEGQKQKFPDSGDGTGLEVRAIWEQYKQNYSDRLAVVDRAVTAWRSDQMTPELRQQALREVHTLAGSLGSFGFREAFLKSREIEEILQAQELPDRPSMEYLEELIIALGREIEQGTADWAAETSDNPILSSSGDISSIHYHKSPSIKQSRLLVVDDDVALAEAVVKEAIAWGMEAEAALNIAQARAAIARKQPDVILLDLGFPEQAENGFQLLAEQTQSPVPVLVFTAQENFIDRVKVARLGARGFLQKPISTTQIMEEIAQVMEKTDPPVAKLLIVDDDPQILDLLRTILEPWGFQITLLDDTKQFWNTLEQSAPDLLILNIEMPEFSGIDLCKVVRNDPQWNDLPVLFLSAHIDAETLHQVFTSGADDYVQKPIVPPELIARVMNRLERHFMRRKLSETDGLTGIKNRRKSEQELTRMLHLAERHKQLLCLILLDLDKFKQVNDQHGHDAGDRVLSQVGELLKQQFRSEDVVGRWGGEEFVVGIYGMSKDMGVERLTAFLENLRQHAFTDANNHQFYVTFSAGVAEYPQDGTDLQALYRAADTTLYQAKAAGRNRVLPVQ